MSNLEKWAKHLTTGLFLALIIVFVISSIMLVYLLATAIGGWFIGFLILVAACTLVSYLMDDD